MTSTVLNKGLIKLFLKYGLMAALMAAGLLAGTFTAGASDGVSCYDVVGQGMDVDYNGTGVFNSGKPIFDYIVPGVAPGYSYQGCLEDTDPVFTYTGNANFGTPPAKYYLVRGWAWDDNLGWISMSCTGGMNLGIACGPWDYGVTIDEFGNFYGYAWGDNTGWISFNNGGFSRLRINVDLPECQGYVYGPTSNPAPGICPVHTKNDTMAWSDNVGWIDFDGVIFPWYQIVEMLTDAEVIVELMPDPNTKFKTAALLADKPLVANGTDNYLVRVTIKDKMGLLIEEPRYITTITLNWLRDTVKKNQIKGGTPLLPLPPCEAVPNANRAVTKPCGLTWAANYIAGTGVWEGLITSIAPTSNMNRLLTNVPTIDYELFKYETFKSPSGFLPTPLETNDLVLGSVDISVLDTANGLCAYGDVLTCNPRTRGFNDPPIRDVIMKFLPQTEITTLNEDENIDFIDVNVNDPQSFTMDGYVKPGATVTLTGGMDGSATALRFVFDTDASGTLVWSVDPVTWNVETVLGGMSSFIAGVAQEPDSTVSQFLKGLHIYSTVNEGNGVTYYSNKLPRVIGSTGVQPVAILRGSVYSVGASTTTSTVGEVIRSLGDISTNILENEITENVERIVAGKTKPVPGDVVIVESQVKPDGFENGGSGNIELMEEDLSGTPKVYYANGDVHVGREGDTLTWGGERTIVTKGGNIYIDADLYNPGISPRPKLALIALKDRATMNTSMQGNIYIHTSVTNIQANMFAAGSVFTYDDGMTLLADGRPDFGTMENYIALTKPYQLFIEGSVASKNTIGGSNKYPRIDGWGKRIEPDDILRARQYDLNYLRMYTGLIDRAPDGTALDAITGLPLTLESDLQLVTAAGLPWSKHMTPPGDLWPPNELESGSYFPAQGLDPLLDLGSTYIFYDPPTQTLPGFQGSSEFEFSLSPG